MLRNLLELILLWVQEPTWKLVALMFFNGFWIVVVWWLLQEVWETFQFWTAGMWSQKNRKHIFLAIDVPSDTEQTPAAMEAIFNQLAGAHGSSTWWDSRWKGEFLDWFSFEIVSLDGYVQYIIRCPEVQRDLVEAAIYAQYPDAEISEVADYVDDVPTTWPQEDWDFFGTGYILRKPDAYPIKTYNEFEDSIRGELVDPMSAMLEIMSKIGKGEQIWYQVVAKPIVDSDWLPQAQDEIDKLTDRYKAPERGGIIGFLLKIPHMITSLIDSFADTQFVQSGGGDDGGNELAKSPMFSLTPGERSVLEDMERKTGKLAYKCYIRIAYVGKRANYSKARGVGPVVGAMKQFTDPSKNSFHITKHSWTKANYWFKKPRVYQRMQSFYDAYASRSLFAGDQPGGFVLNSEELATIYHFPMMSVKAPMVKRTGAKKSEPPSSLPIGEIGGMSIDLNRGASLANASSSAPEPPSTSSMPEPPSSAPEPPSVQSKIENDAPKQGVQGVSTVVNEDDVKMISIPD